MAADVRWGLVGTGTFADRAVAPAIAAVPGCELVAVCSRDLARARAFAARHGVPAALDSYEDMLALADVDAVYVATPNHLHMAQGIAALHAGKHVLVEKPLALDVREGSALVAAAEEAGSLLGTGFHLRHKASARAARDLVRRGALGEVFLVDLHLGAGQHVYPYDTWRSDRRAAGGGTLVNQGTHVLDLLLFLTGQEAREASGVADREGLEDVFAALVVLDGGTIATVSAHQRLAGTRPDFVVAGSQGWLRAAGGTAPGPGDVLTLHAPEGPREVAHGSASAYEEEVAAFARAVRGEAPLEASGADGLRNLALLEALYRSAREGRRVEVETVGAAGP